MVPSEISETKIRTTREELMQIFETSRVIDNKIRRRQTTEDDFFIWSDFDSNF